MQCPEVWQGQRWQVKLAGEWRDFSENEDLLIKRAFEARQSECTFIARGQAYCIDFQRMVQKNTKTPPFKTRPIRHVSLVRKQALNDEPEPDVEQAPNPFRPTGAPGPPKRSPSLGYFRPTNQEASPSPGAAESSPKTQEREKAPSPTKPPPAVPTSNSRPPSLCSSSAGQLSVTVQTLTGKSVALSGISADMTVIELKRRLEGTEQIAAGQQRLVYAGRQMEDSKTLADYSVRSGGVITLLLKL
ncbi:unnamed protein product [Amoebophrya sp. A25]|nr:unnamed protein product [Amoebophrya sp. A25]|eukprot:GSA25T00024038001.1